MKPIRNDASKKNSTAPKTPAPGNAILLVEDEPEIRQFLLEMLKAEGYTVSTASNGEEAMEQARQDENGEIKLLIADLVMPKVGGLELASWFRDEFPNARILIISGYTDDMVLFDDRLAQKTSFLSKPFRSEPFKAKVAELLQS